jgi:type IV secretion system protein TrbL
MGFTDATHRLAAHAHAAASSGGGGGGIAGILRSIEGTVGALSHTIGGVFAGVGATGLVDSLSKALLGGFFHGLLAWVAAGAASLVGAFGKALSASTEPVLSGKAFRSEFAVMAVLSAGVALPLLAVGAIQAVARQEPGTLLRSALVRLPLALLFTGVSVQLVALGLAATDQASAMVLGAASDPTHKLLLGLVGALARTGGFGLAAFGAFLVVLAAAIVAFVLWLELAVRSAAIAAAAMFLPLALAGVAWPATAHWARRLGETLAALVLSKLVIAAVLALAAGLLGDSSGVAGVVEGLALLAVAAFAPFALLKLVPAVEAGAAAHLEGLGRRPVHAAQRLGTEIAGIESGGIQDVGAVVGAAGGGSNGAGPGLGAGSIDVVGEGPFGGERAMPDGGSGDGSTEASDDTSKAAGARWALVLAQGEPRDD